MTQYPSLTYLDTPLPQMAQQAVSYFDKSFALTSKLSVSLAFSKKEGPPPTSEYRPWSKHSVGSSRLKQQQEQHKEAKDKKAYENENKNGDSSGEEEDGLLNKESEDIRRKRDEFLSAMGVSVSSSKQGKGKENLVSKSKFWANDDAIVAPGVELADAIHNDSPNDIKHGGSDSENGEENSCDSYASDVNEKISDVKDNKKESKDEFTSDLDFLRSKQVKADILTDDDSDEEEKDHDSDDDSSSSKSDFDKFNGSRGDSSDGDNGDDDSKRENHGESSSVTVTKDDDPTKPLTNAQAHNTLVDRLFVRNLPFTTTEEDLFETFSLFGNVSAVHIPVDDTKRNKGYAFIQYGSKHDAKLAMDTMDGTDFQGRLIHILPARPSADQANYADGNTCMTYKERQALARQKEAETSTKSWSASFLRGDTVVDNLSDRLGVSKGDILNVKDGISSGNAAVRLALGETHIISENIAFFEKHGVDVRALESNSDNGGSIPRKRSTTMILVKNLPYDTSLEDLTKVFHGIGVDFPQRILFPPSKTAALVEYGHSSDARRAFRRLAYKKFKHVPLYLEWAPMMAGAKKECPSSETTGNVQVEDSGAFSVKKGLIDVDDPSAEAAETGVSQSIYVKNLNFSTSEEQLKAAFANAGFEPRAVRIPTKAAPIRKRSGSSSAANESNCNETKQISLGFGFVEFPSEEDAIKAMKSLQGKLLDGHALEIKLSTKNVSSSKLLASRNDTSSKNTKIIVRNVPFEATRSELLPKKFDGTHRGFAFCEFLTSKEAKNAMTTLSGTHLYGRHLVLEWAAAEEEGEGKVDVHAVREKAKRDAVRAGLAGVNGGSKTTRKR